MHGLIKTAGNVYMKENIENGIDFPLSKSNYVKFSKLIF